MAMKAQTNPDAAPVVLGASAGDADGAAGGPGDGCGPGVCLQGTRVSEPLTGVADFSQDPRADHLSQAREARDDRVVGMLAEQLSGCFAELLDATARCVERREQREGLNSHGLLNQRVVLQVRLAQGLMDPVRCRINPALAAPAAQRCRDLRAAQSDCLGGRRGDGQDRSRVAAGQLRGTEGSQEAGVVLAQDRAQFLQRLGPPPGGVLVSAGEHGYRACQRRVIRQSPVHVRVGAQDIGQCDGVGVIRLAPRSCMPVPGTGHRQRIDRIDRSASGVQGRDQQSAWCLDRYRDRLVFGVAGSREHLRQLGMALGGVADPTPGYKRPGLIDQGNVMMPL